MKDWIPLPQTLVWPTLILILLYRFRAQIDRLVESIHLRIEKGDPFEAGTSGIKLGAASPAVAKGSEPSPGAQRLLGPSPTAAAKATIEADKKPKTAATERPKLSLIHTARCDRSLDRGEYTYYRIRVFLEEEEGELDQVAKVIYHLHPTFRDPDRVVTDRATRFELTTAAWGMFNLAADVYLHGKSEPLKLERYINF